jgi:hypothetical protein
VTITPPRTAPTGCPGLAALQDAFTTCPEDVLRRIAEGSPRFADWRTVDLLMGLDEYEADRRLADGTYRRMTAQGARQRCRLHPGARADDHETVVRVEAQQMRPHGQHVGR